MRRKLSVFLITGACLFIFVSTSVFNKNENRKPIGFNRHIDDAIGGGEPRLPHPGLPVLSYTDDEPRVVKDSFFTISSNELHTSGRTFYDFQSNGVPQEIWQDADRPSNIHAVFMIDPIGASTFPDRKSRYFFSSDYGNTWGYFGNVPSVRSGFPGISVFSDGTAAVMNHTTDGGGLQRIQSYKDIFIGVGSFNRCDPAVNANIWWPNFVTSSNISQLNKIVFVAGHEFDTAYLNRLTGLAPTCSFSGYVQYPNIENANSCNLARGSDGRIGIAYVSNFDLSPYPDGSVFFMESTNNGATFSVPQQIWFPNYITGDSMGALRGVDIVYQINSPKVVFSVCKQDGQGSYFPYNPSKTYHWSPGINGGSPVLIDSAGGMTGSIEFDGYFSSCRPAVGSSNDGNYVYVAWCRSRIETLQSVNYFDVYFALSTNGGATWLSRTQITNTSGSLRDCRYVSMSPINNQTLGSYYVHLLYQSDSIPGSFVTGYSQMSLARMMYTKIQFSFTGIKIINSRISNQFFLSQNYPNPFNPVTKIRFELPAGATRRVALTVFDALGRVIATLVDQELSPGTYEVEWNATNFSSGIYFYKMETSGYTYVKKMVLIK